MFSINTAAQPAELVLAAFEPLAIFFIAGAALMIGAIVWAIITPDAPLEGGEADDDLDVKTTKR